MEITQVDGTTKTIDLSRAKFRCKRCKRQVKNHLLGIFGTDSGWHTEHSVCGACGSTKSETIMPDHEDYKKLRKHNSINFNQWIELIYKDNKTVKIRVHGYKIIVKET